MTTMPLDHLESRDVVLADEADARIAGLAREIDDLQARAQAATSHLAPAEARDAALGDAEMSQAAQLTVQFVEDLVATNRERMRESMAQRHAWVGERLANAEAEGQAIRDVALAELTAAVCAHDATRAALPGPLGIAEMIASIEAPAVADSATPAPIGDVAGPADAAEPAGPEDGDHLAPEVPRLALVSGGPTAGRTETIGHRVAESEAASTIDAAVESAVQAVLRELADPQPSTPPANVASVIDEGQEGGFGDDYASGGDQLERAHEDFWSGEPKATDPPPSRFVPRDLIIAMLVVVVVVLVALVVIG